MLLGDTYQSRFGSNMHHYSLATNWSLSEESKNLPATFSSAAIASRLRPYQSFYRRFAMEPVTILERILYVKAMNYENNNIVYTCFQRIESYQFPYIHATLSTSSFSPRFCLDLIHTLWSTLLSSLRERTLHILQIIYAWISRILSSWILIALAFTSLFVSLRTHAKFGTTERGAWSWAVSWEGREKKATPFHFRCSDTSLLSHSSNHEIQTTIECYERCGLLVPVNETSCRKGSRAWQEETNRGRKCGKRISNSKLPLELSWISRAKF